MARINITRLAHGLPVGGELDFDILIRELESIINQLNFTFQQDLREESTARTWFLT